jgi:hypothetical protein
MPFGDGKQDPVEAGKRGAEARWGAPAGEVKGPVDVLAEMERVLMTPAEEDRTPYQKRLRQLFQEDFKEFHRELVAERATRAKAGSNGPCPKCAAREAEEKTDEGSEKALEMARRWLEAHTKT